MSADFSLEIFYESVDEVQDRQFVEPEAEKLKRLVRELAPHIRLKISVHRATCIVRGPGGLPAHEPTDGRSQTLLITSEDIGAKGRGWRGNRGDWPGPGAGCVSRESMTHMRDDSVEITIHEWIHTIEGETINGRALPDLDNAGFSIPHDREKAVDGSDKWHNAFTYLLRENP